MKRYWKYIKPYLPAFIIGPLMMIVEVIGEVVLPKLMANIINVGVTNGSAGYITGTGALMILVALLMMAGGVGGAYFGAKAAVSFAADLRKDAFDKVQTFSFANLDQFSTGSLVTRLTNDITQVQNLINMALRMMLRAPGMLIGALIMAFVMNAELAVIVLIVIPILVGAIAVLIKIAFPKFKIMQKKLDALNSNIQEMLTNVRVIKSFVRGDYEEKKFVGKAENITVGEMLDMWVEEELKPGSLSNGTVMAYMAAVKKIKKYPIGSRKLKTVTADHLQSFIDLMSYGGINPGGTTSKPMSKGYMLQFSAVLQNSFRFAVFPKRLITFNPMQYVKLRGRKEETDIFSDSEEDIVPVPTITHGEYQKLTDFLTQKKHPALLAVQIAYYAGLRIGEVCGLTWQDINLDEQYLTVRRSMRYNGTRHKHEVGTTKRSKVRTVDFCDTLADILRKVKTEQHKNRFLYGELYHLNYCKTVKEKGRTYYEVYSLQRTQETPENDRELSFVCLKEDGAFVSASAVGQICRKAKAEVEGLEDFHFHTLRHTYTSNLLSGGAKPKDVQELLGHSDVSTTMNIYAHSTREAKRTSARLLDKVVGEA